jgi:hypothetical protein
MIPAPSRDSVRDLIKSGAVTPDIGQDTPMGIAMRDGNIQVD